VAVIDIISVVAEFPKPDDKIKTIATDIQGGGNCGNALTLTSRLGVDCYLISKYGTDIIGKQILNTLITENIKIDYCISNDTIKSSFAYMIVDLKEKTRTSIFTPGDDLELSELPDKYHFMTEILPKIGLLYTDSRHTKVALQVASYAKEVNIPVIIDLEKDRPHLMQLLNYVDYVIESQQFANQYYTDILHKSSSDKNVLESAVELLKTLPYGKFVIVTLGNVGCVLVCKGKEIDHFVFSETVDTVLPTVRHLNKLLETINNYQQAQYKDEDGTIFRVLYHKAYPIDQARVVDTTGAGDAFIGAIGYCLLKSINENKKVNVERMLNFACYMAANKCLKMGARSGILKFNELNPQLLENIV